MYNKQWLNQRPTYYVYFTARSVVVMLDIASYKPLNDLNTNHIHVLALKFSISFIKDIILT